MAQCLRRWSCNGIGDGRVGSNPISLNEISIFYWLLNFSNVVLIRNLGGGELWEAGKNDVMVAIMISIMLVNDDHFFYFGCLFLEMCCL